MAKPVKVGGGEEVPQEEVEIMPPKPPKAPVQEGEASKLIEEAIAKVQAEEPTIYMERAVAKLRAVQVLLRVG